MPRVKGQYFVWITIAIQSSINSQGKNLFTPSDDAYDNDYGKNSCRDQVALYIHIVKQGVEFFHNLNFCFQKWFRSGFQGAEVVCTLQGAIQKEYGG